MQEELPDSLATALMVAVKDLRKDVRVMRGQIAQLRMLVLVLFIALSWFIGEISAATPSEELTSVLADLERVPEINRYSTRYLSLESILPEEREGAELAISYILNSISRSGVIVRPGRVSATLIRVDLRAYAPKDADYAGFAATWESLALIDPYYHTTLIVPGKNGDKLKVVTDGGWLDQQCTAQIRELTGSTCAVLRADWFLDAVCTSKFYYEFSGIDANRKVYLKGLGLDDSKVIGIRAVLAANIKVSGVTDSLRRLSRWPTPNGDVWITYDTAKKRQSPNTDPFHDPTLRLGFEASELIATKANGLPEYTLFLKNGDRADEVDSDIAVDYSVHPPVTLTPPLSCIRCHFVEGEDGLRSFKDQQSGLLASGRVKLLSGKKEVVEELESIYGRQPRLTLELNRDREDFSSALKYLHPEATPVSVGAALASMHSTYVNTLVDPAQACRELGVPLECLPDLAENTNSETIMFLAEGQAVQRKQFEFAFPELAILASVERVVP